MKFIDGMFDSIMNGEGLLEKRKYLEERFNFYLRGDVSLSGKIFNFS